MEIIISSALEQNSTVVRKTNLSKLLARHDRKAQSEDEHHK